MEIITGIIFGIIVSSIGAYWLTKKNNEKGLEEIEREKEELEQEDKTWQERSYPLEQKLRNAIFESEQNQKECDTKIKELCQNQLDLVVGLGKKSHVEVKGKALFFEYKNPLTKERYFYYERDLNKNNAAEELEKTKKILLEYAKQIDLLETQKDFFAQLILSHNQNIDRLKGLQKGSTQMKKINEHQSKLEQLNYQKIEEDAIYNDLIMNEIDEELDYQEECLKQYLVLKQEYKLPIDSIEHSAADEKLQIEIKEIIKHLEDKNPKL